MKAKGRYLIRQAMPADKAAIFRFIRKAYPNRWQYKIPDRWAWEFEHNPFRDPSRLPIWIALDSESGDIVGQSCALVEPFYLEGKSFRVGWGVDFFVLPAHRGQGLGTRLQAANQVGNEIFMSLDMAEAARRIKLRIGMRPLPAVPIYERILHHDPNSVATTLKKRSRILGKLAQVVGLHFIIARGLTFRESKRNLPRKGAWTPPITLEKISRFDERVNILWEQLSPRYKALTRRNATYLNWKFTRQPHMSHHCFLAHKGSKTCGYLVLRCGSPPERNAGILVDLFTAPDDEETMRSLLIHALQFFWERKVTYVTAASSVVLFQQVLTSQHFKLVNTTIPMISAPVSLPQDGWVFGKGDHDWDQFPLA